MEGSSVNLKNRFAGYNIELVVRQNSVNEVMAMVSERLPGRVTVDCMCLRNCYIVLCGM